MGYETADLLTIANVTYDAKMYYDKAARKIDNLTNPLGAGARTSYRRSWGRWLAFYRGRDPLFGVISKRNFGVWGLMNFILANVIRGEYCFQDSE